jgi:hypothetical protein
MSTPSADQPTPKGKPPPQLLDALERASGEHHDLNRRALEFVLSRTSGGGGIRELRDAQPLLPPEVENDEE